jgi:hypothetical protein
MVGAIHRIARAIGVNRPYLLVLLVAVTSCATTSRHKFEEPVREWTVRTGQLLYRNDKTTIIGDVVVRFSGDDFYLTLLKGSEIVLLSLQEDKNFAEVKGPLAGRGWSGPIDRAPQQLRGWLELRGKIVRAQDRHQVRHVSGSETFVFRF